MNIRNRFTAFAYLLVLTILSGCTAIATGITQTPFIETLAPTLTKSPFPQATLTSEPSKPSQTLSPPQIAPGTSTILPRTAVTPFPTIAQTQEAAVAALLASESCDLPCYFGITPGETSKDVAEAILASLGAQNRFDWNFVEDGLQGYGFQIWIGDDSLADATRVPYSAPREEEIYQQFNITIEDNKVQRVFTHIVTTRLSDKFEKYWSKYTLKRVFLSLGVPDMAVASIRRNSYNILVVYESAGVVLETAGTKRSLICPP